MNTATAVLPLFSSQDAFLHELTLDIGGDREPQPRLRINPLIEFSQGDEAFFSSLQSKLGRNFSLTRWYSGYLLRETQGGCRGSFGQPTPLAAWAGENTGRIEEDAMRIARAKDATSSYEYGCDLRRLYPWADVADPLWGSAIASVRPSESTTPHSHDEEETFLILDGAGIITVDDESSPIEAGDVIYLPRFSHHTVRNTSSLVPLRFLTIFWGSPEANARLMHIADQLKASTQPEA
ncbi:cupin domain-containing protein [Methylobacterium sp. SyP6R]|uniref:cupin domain-containing protein n=1 Tax=Methylobacterium sp. SyP6R TaxID=2718876 RepID=UPI001F1DBC43|nr:cupin domain-containing protein [Methylobacterium sp. SyP6R]MCF4130072.1 cupin domain-containing protein [Methylobacterium sp. SyP6R]